MADGVGNGWLVVLAVGGDDDVGSGWGWQWVGNFYQ